MTTQFTELCPYAKNVQDITMCNLNETVCSTMSGSQCTVYNDYLQGLKAEEQAELDSLKHCTYQHCVPW